MYSRTSMTRTQVSGFELSGRSIMHSYSHDPMTHKTQICCKNHNSSYRGKAVLSRKMNEILLSWRGTRVRVLVQVQRRWDLNSLVTVVLLYYQ